MEESINSRESHAVDPRDVETVLELKSVDVLGDRDVQVVANRLSWRVQRGQIAIVRCAPMQRVREFSSVLQGLSAPRRGSVQFESVDWEDMTYADQFNARARIGRVFDGDGWIANLTVRENVLLSAQHHRLEDERVADGVEHWLSWFGLSALSNQRPGFVSESRLQIYQWIRALITSPVLLILERPIRKVGQKPRVRLAEAIRRQVTLGSAVIWMSDRDDTSELFPDALGPTLDLRRESVGGESSHE